jgi:hypothetical protein
MTSILYHSGLNYGATNPLRGELNIIRDSVHVLEKNFKDISALRDAASGAGGGARGVTAGLKEVALQIVTLRSDIEGLKTRMTSAEAEKRRVDALLTELTSRMALTESAVGAAVNTVSALNSTVSSLAAGAGIAVTVVEMPIIDLLASDVEAPGEAIPETQAAVVEESAVAADEDEAASEEILAMLRSA